MSNTQKIIGAMILVVIIAALVWFQYAQRSAPNSSAAPAATEVSTSTPTAASSTATRTAVPSNVVVPNKGSSSTAANVAVPVTQGAGDPAGNVSYRSFNITIQNGAYTPNTVIVNQNDTVNLNVTAVDAAYGFDQLDYGLHVAIPKGKTQLVQFQASAAGDFTFYCVSCGGPSKGPVGHIIVVAK